MSSQTEESIQEGKAREETLFSFKAIGAAVIGLGGLLFLLGMLTVIFASIRHSWYHPLSLSGCGIWCGLFSIPGGIMSIAVANKATYFSAGWAMICSIFGSFFSFLLCSLSLAGAIEAVERSFDEVVVFNILLFIFGIAQLVLCCYNSVVFSRLSASYPYHVRKQDHLCPCSVNSQNQSSFGNVMYSTIVPKKHDY